MRFTTVVVAITLSVLAVLTTPAAAQTARPDAPASASWHGRAIEAPQERPRGVKATWPRGWSAGAVHRGSGFLRRGGSKRVRDVQRRLTKLGYRPGPADGPSVVPYLIASAVALALGVLVGALLPRRRRPTLPVLGYVRHGETDVVTATAAALDEICARRRWSLIRVVQETDDAGTRLFERPGLLHAIEQIEQGAAAGLVTLRIRELSTRLDDLATLLQLLGAANGFLATADDDLDTSTADGQAAAATVIDIAGWRNRPAVEPSRFRPPVEPHIAAMQDRGVPTETIADALNLAGVPAPGPRDHWEPSDVAAASRRAQEAHS